jgi:hypothetical protein
MATILFFDDWALQSIHNVERVMGRPRWVPEATLEDPLTEGTYNFPFVWKDPESGRWKAIYGAALELDGVRPKGGIHNPHAGRAQALMYAESDDGIHWTRPDVRDRVTHVPRTEVDGLNMVYSVEGHLDGLPVFWDPKNTDGMGPLRYLFSEDGRQGMAASQDGIQWHEAPEVEIAKHTLDSPITAYYNHYRDSYIMPRRLFAGDRRIALFETRDWKTFAHPELALWPTCHDHHMLQFYGMPVQRYEHLYIGLLWRLYCRSEGDYSAVKGRGGPIDCSLAYSLDGKHFQRATYDAFIPRPELGEHGGGCLYTGCFAVDEDAGEIRFYSGGSKAEHFIDQTLNDAALMMHTLRMDGFFRYESYCLQGSVMTRRVVFTGDSALRINARAPHGEVRVRILTTGGASVPGYDFSDCRPLVGDQVNWTPEWTSGKRVADLDRKTEYHIEVQIACGELYAIRGDFKLCYGFGHDKAAALYLP